LLAQSKNSPANLYSNLRTRVCVCVRNSLVLLRQDQARLVAACLPLSTAHSTSIKSHLCWHGHLLGSPGTPSGLPDTCSGMSSAWLARHPVHIAHRTLWLAFLICLLPGFPGSPLNNTTSGRLTGPSCSPHNPPRSGMCAYP